MAEMFSRLEEVLVPSAPHLDELGPSLRRLQLQEALVEPEPVLQRL